MSFSSNLRKQLGEMYNKAVDNEITYLKKLGGRAIRYAYKKGHGNGKVRNHGPYRDGKWRHRSYNLHDSIGSAVFVAGNVIEDSITVIGGGSKSRGLSTKNDRRTGRSGRSTLLEFFHNSHFGQKKGEIVLVCMAAMYYSGFLEGGYHYGHYKIQVISAARDYIERYRKKTDVKSRVMVKRYVRLHKGEWDKLGDI